MPRLYVKELGGPALEEQRAVGAAETEGIAEGIFHAGFTRVVRNVVQVALRILLVKIDSGRKALIAQFTGGNPAIGASLKRMWQENPDGLAHKSGVDMEVAKFMGKAMERLG